MQHNKITINKKALHTNISIFEKLVENDVDICGVVKANAYGHGVKEVVNVLLENKKITWWAVNSFEEAVEVRGLDAKRPILILCDVPSEQFEQVAQYNFSLVISHKDQIQKLGKLKKDIFVHIKIDTGVGRLGVQVSGLKDLLQEIQKYNNIYIQGVMSHFANAEDVLVQDYALQQIERFEEAREIMRSALGQQKLEEIIFHMSATAATLLLPQAHYNMVRIGIGLYGLWPSHETKLSFYKEHNYVPDLQPILGWQSRIIHLKKMDKGEYIGYGCTYQLKRDSLIATLPIGYYEGYNRLLSNNADVIIHGQRCAVVGRVSMHMITVDVTDLEYVNVYDEVGIVEQEITLDELAQKSQTINYEFVTRLNGKMQREIM